MARHHDDGHVRVGAGFGLADHAGQFDAIENRHGPIRDDDIGRIGGEGLKTSRAIFGLIGFAHAKAMQKRPDDAAHMVVVIHDKKAQATAFDAEHDTQLHPGKQPDRRLSMREDA